MTRGKPFRLDPSTRTALRKLQGDVDSETAFTLQVEEGRRLFKQKNKAKDATFKVVRAKLKDVPHAGHCAYCEVDTAAEIDHFKPVSLFPDATFRPGNYVPCCAICNKQKGERFPTFDSLVGTAVTVHRVPRGSVLMASPTGVSAALSPRWGSLLDYAELDFGTFLYVVTAPAGSRERAMAEKTIHLLGLNARERLREKREWAYDQYLTALRDYVRDHGTMSASEKLARADRVRRVHCLSVWKEMKRQQANYPELASLFAATPDPLGW